MKNAGKEHTQLGDALRGERISVQARSIDPTRYGTGSGKHKIQFTILRDSAYCVIDIPLRALALKKN